MTGEHAGFLAGVRVLEVAALTNGDYLGMLLADLGADVIKVEDPERGDYLRSILGQIAPEHSPSHEQFNRGKRSVALDLRSEQGLETFWKLLSTADVFVDGYVAGALDRLGLGYEALRARRPDLVYCSVTGYGSTGPYAELPTHGRMMNALAGGKPHERDADGLMRSVPDPAPMAGTTVSGQGPVLAGLFGVQYVLAALVERSRDGSGCFIDVSGADAVIAASPQGSVYAWNDHLITDRSSLPVKTDAEDGSATYQYYETSDGLVVLLGALERKLWARFCDAVDRPDLRDQVAPGADVDFAAGQLELRHELQKLFETRSQRDWMALAVQHRLPIAPAYRSPAAALDDPHLHARDIIHRAQLPDDLGEFVYVGRPAVIPGKPFRIARPAPNLGQHTEEILAELELGEAR